MTRQYSQENINILISDIQTQLVLYHCMHNNIKHNIKGPFYICQRVGNKNKGKKQSKTDNNNNL